MSSSRRPRHVSDRIRGERDVDVQGGARAGGALDLQLAAEQGHALAHPAQPQPKRLLVRGERVIVVESSA